MSGLFILGVILLILGFAASAVNPNLQRFSNLFRIGGVVVIILAFFSSAIRIIEPGRIGLQVLFGEVKPTVLSNGLNIINPLVKVEDFDVTTQTYTMVAAEQEGNNQGYDATKVLSADGLEVSIDMTLLYKVDPSKVMQIRKEIGPGKAYEDKIVRPTARTRVRETAANFNAVDLYSTKREQFQLKIQEIIKKDFEGRGLILEELLVRNIELPQSVKSAIEAKINAEQDAQKMQFVLQKEQQEAERKRVEAQGIADYQRIINLSLTDKQLQYENIKTMQELVKSPNSKVIFMGGKGGSASVLVGDK